LMRKGSMIVLWWDMPSPEQEPCADGMTVFRRPSWELELRGPGLNPP
jgi:hypothetical protein